MTDPRMIDVGASLVTVRLKLKIDNHIKDTSEHTRT